MSMSMKESLVQQCLEVLKRDDVKNECKALFMPVMDFVLYEINPYIYMTVGLIFMIFAMILAILIILILILRNKSLLSKIF